MCYNANYNPDRLGKSVSRLSTCNTSTPQGGTRLPSCPGESPPMHANALQANTAPLLEDAVSLVSSPWGDTHSCCAPFPLQLSCVPRAARYTALPSKTFRDCSPYVRIDSRKRPGGSVYRIQPKYSLQKSLNLSQILLHTYHAPKHGFDQLCCRCPCDAR